jgi:hypothetical protein
MTKLREQIETPLATKAAFAFVADFANSSIWDPGVETSERLDPGPVGSAVASPRWSIRSPSSRRPIASC